MNVNIFTFDGTDSNANVLGIDTANTAHANTYNLQIRIYLPDYLTATDVKVPFVVNILSSCIPTSVSISNCNIRQVTYELDEGLKTKNNCKFDPTPNYCEVTYSSTYSVPPPGNLIAVDSTTGEIRIDGTGWDYSWAIDYVITIKAIDANGGDRSTI